MGIGCQSHTVNTDKQNLPWVGEQGECSASLCSHSCKLKFGAHFKNFVTLMFLMIIFCMTAQVCNCLSGHMKKNEIFLILLS
jgi:hypothetical protein